MRDKIKRTAVLTFLKKQKADITTLVETHVTGHLQAALRCPWIGWTYRSTHTNLSGGGGVTILLAKSAPFELLSVETDQQGRYIFMHAFIGGAPLLLIASYTPPPPYRAEVVTEGLAFIAQHPTVPAIWMGDFNNTMSPTIDHPTQPVAQMAEPRQTRLSCTMTEFALVNVWRQNPTTRAYTCHSTSHNTMSRIDYVLVSQALLPKITGLGIAPRTLSLALLGDSLPENCPPSENVEIESPLALGHFRPQIH